MIFKQIQLAGLSILLSLLLTQPKVSMSQENTQELNIGDVVPDVKIDNLINYTSNSLYLSDLKGKVVILDFWATWCGPCVGSFPKMDSIQNEFGDKLQILPVTNEKEEEVRKFFDQMKKLNKKVPVTVVNDNKLTRLFQHVYLPHYVWIDASGKVLAITEGKDVNRDNIKNAIDGKGFSFKLKKDLFNVVDESQKGIPVINAGYRIIENNNTVFKKIEDSVVFTQSTLTKAIDGMPAGSSVDSAVIGVWNVPIVWLYRVALWKHGFGMLNEKKTIVEINNPEIFEDVSARSKTTEKQIAGSGQEYKGWIREHGYCYQIKIAKAMDDQKYEIMLDELNRFFGAKYGIEGHIEKRNTACLALVRTSQNEKFAAKEGGKASSEGSKLFLKVKNYMMSGFIAELMTPLQEQPPIVDETNYKGRIDIQLNCDLSDVEALNTELAKYDLKLVKKNTVQEIGVISMKK